VSFTKIFLVVAEINLPVSTYLAVCMCMCVSLSASICLCMSVCVSLLLSYLSEDVDGLTSQMDRDLLRETVKAFTLTNDDLAATCSAGATDDMQLASQSCQVTMSVCLSIYVYVCPTMSLSLYGLSVRSHIVFIKFMWCNSHNGKKETVLHEVEHCLLCCAIMLCDSLSCVSVSSTSEQFCN